MRAAFLDAVVAATERSRELGRRVSRTARRPHHPHFPHQQQAGTVADGVEGVMPHGPVAGAARFLTVAEVADQLRVSNMTVYRLIKAGELRRVAGRQVATASPRTTSTASWPSRYTEAG